MVGRCYWLRGPVSNGSFTGLADHDIGGLKQALDTVIRRLAERFVISVVDEKGCATGRMTTIDIPPPVADHEAVREVNAQIACRSPQHAGLWLPAIALRRALARVIANLHPIQRQFATHVGVKDLNRFLSDGSTAYVWLIGGDDEQETGAL
jgi:hypothetical protein